jgi:hypothetical protein
MARTFTVSGTPYSFPDQGGNPPWGEEVTDWAQAVTDLLGTLTITNAGQVQYTSSSVGASGTMKFRARATTI